MGKVNEYPQLQLDNMLCFSIYASSREITKMYQPYLETLGVTYSQYLVLIVLWEQDERTVKELGEELFLDSGTLTPLLKRLENAGFVSRNRSTEDERKVFISLTDQGRELREKAAHIPECMSRDLHMDVPEFVELLGRFQNLLARAHDVNRSSSGK
ncbi:MULTISPECIES: MarR family winged helix-turn-helix transcriptional regulator [Saccharibacillus]|uniref:MarR family transcriptional regulator n=1 Tax=Saccharibacillus brassicae TaxID=2583377 RepID=A0A4Y6UYK6_SACBS|nr:MULTISPECIES: MarR family transcriptional regulator [Saccharibacillus]MWJ29633.1 MarR family transcriptional regulator [Saccharibacillus sp. WB 17]QDH22839.1 MarR family transcriptional regulator [Saccharibacillus brassicae]